MSGQCNIYLAEADPGFANRGGGGGAKDMRAQSAHYLGARSAKSITAGVQGPLINIRAHKGPGSSRVL